MANKNTDQYLENNKQYASGKALHKAAYPGKQPINPAKHVAVVCLLYTSPSPRDGLLSRMPSSA